MPVYSIYKTTNTVNNKTYIGVHKTENPHDDYLGSGKVIKAAIKKYGKESFRKEILFLFLTLKEAYAKERELVNLEYIERSDVYNLISGGSVSPDWTEERKINFRKTICGPNHHFFGKHHTEETKHKIGQAGIGRVHPKESYEKAARTRRQNKIPCHWKGKTQSKESNEKRSIAHKNLPKLTCPHCSKQISPQNAKLWHYDNCKLNRV